MGGKYFKKIMGISIALLLSITLFSITTFADNEPNDSFDEAESIGEGTFSGSVDSYALINPDTADYYKITVPAYKAVLISVTCGSDSTISYTLYDGNRQEVDWAYVENGEASTLWFDGKNKQNYIAYLKVEDTGDYTFTVKFRPSDMKEAAIELSDGQTVSNTLESAYEVHWYKINIPSSKYLEIEASSSGGAIYLSIEDSQSYCLGSNTGTSITLNTSEYSVTGYVYISVESYEWSNREISYQFTVHLKMPYYVVEGYVYDGNTGEPIAGATVSIGGTTAITDSNGYFSMKLPAGTYTLTVSANGYKEYSESVTVTSDNSYIGDIYLEPASGSNQGKFSATQSTPLNYGLIAGAIIILVVVIIIAVVILATRRSKKEKPPELKPPPW